MILLITPSSRGPECAEAVQAAIGEPAEVSSTLSQAVHALRSQSFSAVVLDQYVLDAEPDESDTILHHLGTAVPVHVNFGIAGSSRIVSELRAALQRRSKETVVAKRAAEQSLRNELKNAVTSILLSCEMALETPNLVPTVEARLRTIDENASSMREKLGISEN